MSNHAGQWTMLAVAIAPDLIGHSLGGLLGMQLSIEAPDRCAHVIIVDSLPFLGGTRNPAATAETVRPTPGLRTKTG